MMSKNMLGMRHTSKRKRSHRSHVVRKSSMARLLDKLVYGVALVGPVMTLPQLYIIWVEHNAHSIALSSFTTYLVVSVFWLVYGVLHREYPIMLSSFVWIIIHSLVVAGAVMYG